MLKGRLNSLKGTDNTCRLVSKALKSHIKAILESVDDIVLLQLLVLTHIYQTICLDKQKGMSVFSTSQPTLSSSHYWLTSGGPDLPSSAKKGSN